MYSEEMVCYIACFYRTGNKKEYRVKFDDFSRMSVTGEDLATAVVRATRALEARIARMEESGQRIPVPADLSVIRMRHEKEECGPELFVPVVTHARGIRVRVNICLDADKLQTITEYARSRGKSRSEVLVSAALNAIEQGG